MARGFRLLAQDEKNKVENEVLGAVFHIAHHLTDDVLFAGMTPPTIN